MQRRVPVGEAISMVLAAKISNFASATLLLGIEVKLARGQLPEDLAMLLQHRLLR